MEHHNRKKKEYSGTSHVRRVQHRRSKFVLFTERPCRWRTIRVQKKIADRGGAIRPCFPTIHPLSKSTPKCACVGNSIPKVCVRENISTHTPDKTDGVLAAHEHRKSGCVPERGQKWHELCVLRRTRVGCTENPGGTSNTSFGAHAQSGHLDNDARIPHYTHAHTTVESGQKWRIHASHTHAQLTQLDTNARTPHFHTRTANQGDVARTPHSHTRAVASAAWKRSSVGSALPSEA